MAKLKIRAVEYTCDGCGSVEIVGPNEEPPHGWHGDDVLHVHTGGGWGCKSWYACSKECITAAIINAIEKENGNH